MAQIDEITRLGSEVTEIMKLDLREKSYSCQCYNAKFRVINFLRSVGLAPTLFAIGMYGDVIVADVEFK